FTEVKCFRLKSIQEIIIAAEPDASIPFQVFRSFISSSCAHARQAVLLKLLTPFGGIMSSEYVKKGILIISKTESGFYERLVNITDPHFNIIAVLPRSKGIDP